MDDRTLDKQLGKVTIFCCGLREIAPINHRFPIGFNNTQVFPRAPEKISLQDLFADLGVNGRSIAFRQLLFFNYRPF